MTMTFMLPQSILRIYSSTSFCYQRKTVIAIIRRQLCQYTPPLKPSCSESAQHRSTNDNSTRFVKLQKDDNSHWLKIQELLSVDELFK
ncbi:hypothetical protein GJ496_002032 [Pomphorhynchus laevis]|nr:hypothetical protein GJ496_002032 [Pomphorhynchus laevis]